MLNPTALAAMEDRRIGPLEFSPARRRLSGPNTNLSLEPLVMNLLLLLAASDGKVISRETLFEQLWGSPTIGDASLNRLIAILRRALNEVGGGVSIETVPRTGYRLLAGDPLAPSISGPPLWSRRTYLALIAGSGALLGGGALLWRFEKKEDDRQTSLLLKQARRTLSLGLPWELPKAQSYAEEAVRREPDDPQALGLLAYIRTLTIPTAAPDARAGLVNETDAVIERAIAVPPLTAEARLAQLMLEQSTLAWAQYEDRLVALHRTDPTSTVVLDELTFFTQGVGHTHQSWSFNEQLMRLDPSSPQPYWRKALKCWILGRTAEADRIIDWVRSLWPEHPWVWNARLLIYAFTDRAEAALAMIEDAASRPRTVNPASMAQWKPTLSALAHRSPANVAAAISANLAAARQSPGQAAYGAMALSALHEIGPAYQVAEGFLIARGPILTRQAANPSRLMVSDPDWRKTQWLFTPPMREFRADQRFRQLCDALSLTEYWRDKGGPDIA